MNLICTNLHPSSAVNLAIYGNFSGPKQQEIATVRGNHLELLRPDENGKLQTICSSPAFAIIRSIVAFRLAGSNRDYVVIGSDSGKVSIVEYDAKINNWKLVHCEVFGKTGCRRIVPGQYIAADPKGRAIMIAGVEKQKLVYVLNRDTSNKLTISSPLEAHKVETIVFSLCGVDVGYENPIFALIELEYSQADQDATGEALQEIEKKLSYYELDLGLNHVVRKWSEPISRTANFLLSVPGGDSWPSGVLICGENWISYKHQGHVEIRAPIPRRHNLPKEKGVLITSGTLHKQKDLFFFIVQSEYGDLYKVTLDQDPNDSKIITNIHISVFDTIQPCNTLCITKTGFLYTSSEISNHFFYQFQGIDDSNAIKSEKITDEVLNEELGDDSLSASRVAPIFKPSNKLSNLLIADTISSLAPITDLIATDLLGDDAIQLYAACGKGNRSTFRVLRHGISVSELASIDLPGRATAVWTIKKTQDDENDAYIVVSFTTSTLVLAVGETIEEVTDSGFLTTTATLQVALLADNAILQVYANGIRHIRANAAPTEWKPPPRRSIQLASVNERQVAISLSGGEITYFELDEAGQLVEMSQTDMGREISCLDVGIIPEGRSRSSFMAVGCWDNTFQLLSLDPSDLLSKGQIQPTGDSRPTSVCFVEMLRETSYDEEGNNRNNNNIVNNAEGVRSLYLNIGLEKGVIRRVAVDQVTGDLSDPREKFLGPKGIKLNRLKINQYSSIIAFTTRSWLFYNYDNHYHQDPLSYDGLEYGTDITSEIFGKGMVGIIGNSLRILTIEHLGGLFNETSYPLRYTPRKMVLLPNTSDMIVIETDHNEFNDSETNQLEQQYAITATAEQKEGNEVSSSMEVANAADGEDDSDRTVIVRGPVPGSDGKWASAIRILDGKNGTTKTFFDLSENEAAFSVCTCRFSHHSEETFLIVGTVKDLIVTTRKFSSAYLHVYRMIENTLQLLHKTEVEDIPQAMIEFQGKLLVGVGRHLRLYELGKKKLLKKTENKSFPTAIVKLQVLGDRIYVGDAAQSIIFVKYRANDNLFGIFADDTLPRFITCMTVMDYNTVACGDKFGNVYVLRLSDTVNDEHVNIVTGGNLWDQGLLNGAPNKVETVANFYLGDIPTQILKTSFKSHDREVLLISTIQGGLYTLIPCKSKDEMIFYTHLEMFMRQEYTNICQRDHLSYRSYFLPVKNVVDGELCQKFVTGLSYAKQKEFSENVDRSILDILKKLEEVHDFL